MYEYLIESLNNSNTSTVQSEQLIFQTCNTDFRFLDELGGGVPLLYLTTFTLSASEVVALSGSQLVLSRIGHSMAHLLVLGAYGLRFIWYAMAPSAEWTLLAAPLHSVTTGLQWIAMAAQVAALAPSGAQSSALGLAYGVQSGPGAAFGYLLGGLLFGAIGARALFLGGRCTRSGRSRALLRSARGSPPSPPRD